jgi:hypothetical protein
LLDDFLVAFSEETEGRINARTIAQRELDRSLHISADGSVRQARMQIVERYFAAVHRTGSEASRSSDRSFLVRPTSASRENDQCGNQSDRSMFAGSAIAILDQFASPISAEINFSTRNRCQTDLLTKIHGSKSRS